jgi:predicted O-methyltransferase YrrM
MLPIPPDLTEGRLVLGELQRTRPRFHHAEDRRQDWSLDGAVLEWLFDHCIPGGRTLETGSGYSTIAFALRGTEHISISPAPEEHARLRSWCTDHGVSLEGVRFVPGRSDDVLPGLSPGPLDLVLIDGDHAFPTPFLDWRYTAPHLAVGGMVVVDDTDIRTGRLLVDFLAGERGRWAERARFDRAVVFEKITVDVVGRGFWEQPWCATKVRTPAQHVNDLRRDGIGRIRNRVRLRSRIRQIMGGRADLP